MCPSSAGRTATNSQESTLLVPTAKSTANGNEVVSLRPNPSLQVTPDHQLKQTEAPVLSPLNGEVLVHIKATGICGYVFD